MVSSIVRTLVPPKREAFRMQFERVRASNLFEWKAGHFPLNTPVGNSLSIYIKTTCFCGTQPWTHMRHHAPFKFDRDLDCRFLEPLLGDNFSGTQPSLALPSDAGQSRALPDTFGTSSLLHYVGWWVLRATT